MDVKNLNFNRFNFNIDRRLLTTERSYKNNTILASLQVDIQKLYNNEQVFNTRLIIQYELPNKKYAVEMQSAFLNLNYEQVYTDTSIEEVERKGYIEKKYMPWVISSIELFKEANHDLLL